MRRRADESGFTLLEVLVAFTIAALLLVAVLRGLTLDLAGSRHAETVTRATILAESVLDAMGVAAPLRDGDEAELHDGPFRVVARAHRLGDSNSTSPGQLLALYELSARVSWQEGARAQAIELQTLRLGRPAKR